MYRTTARHPLFAILCAATLLAGCLGRGGLNLPWSPAHDTQESKLEHVTTATFDERVLKCDKPVLVDFYATWCGPCTKLTPVVEEFAAEHPEYRVVKVNVDDNHELVQKYQVKLMPTLLVIRNGTVVSRSQGLVPKKQLQDMMASGAVAAKAE